MRMWFPWRGCLTKLPLLSSPTPLALPSLNLAQQFRAVKRHKIPGGLASRREVCLTPFTDVSKEFGMGRDLSACVRPVWGRTELRLGQGPFHFLLMAASAHMSQKHF